MGMGGPSAQHVGKDNGRRHGIMKWGTARMGREKGEKNR